MFAAIVNGLSREFEDRTRCSAMFIRVGYNSMRKEEERASVSISGAEVDNLSCKQEVAFLISIE